MQTWTSQPLVLIYIIAATLPPAFDMPCHTSATCGNCKTLTNAPPDRATSCPCLFVPDCQTCTCFHPPIFPPSPLDFARATPAPLPRPPSPAIVRDTNGARKTTYPWRDVGYAGCPCTSRIQAKPTLVTTWDLGHHEKNFYIMPMRLEV
jgi:hypothetical protein